VADHLCRPVRRLLPLPAWFSSAMEDKPTAKDGPEEVGMTKGYPQQIGLCRLESEVSPTPKLLKLATEPDSSAEKSDRMSSSVKSDDDSIIAGCSRLRCQNLDPLHSFLCRT